CAEHPPPDNGRCRRIWGMHWSPNGARLAFFRETGLSRQFHAGLYVSTKVTGPPRVRTRRLAACDSWCEVDWSPDASQLVVADDSLSIVDVGTGVRTPLTRDPRDSSPVWSPTAPVIAFLRGSSLFTVHADSTRLTRLATFNPHLPAYSLTWSP